MRDTRGRLGIGVMLVFALVGGGCYHAVIETGKQPSGTVVDDEWADSFAYGLAPPDVVNTAQQCPDRVARVETRHSFMNLLVGALTMGIYTPMHITAHCAAAGGEEVPEQQTVRVDANGGADALASALARAARLSVDTDAPAFVILAR